MPLDSSTSSTSRTTTARYMCGGATSLNSLQPASAFDARALTKFDFTGFDWVFMGFTGFYWVLLGFNGFYWVLLSLIGFSLV